MLVQDDKKNWHEGSVTARSPYDIDIFRFYMEFQIDILGWIIIFTVVIRVFFRSGQTKQRQGS